MIKYDTYRDGGTKGFRAFWITSHFGGKYEDNIEVCLSTKDEWFLGHPNNGRLLTNEEINYVVPKILSDIKKDIDWRTSFLKDLTNEK